MDNKTTLSYSYSDCSDENVSLTMSSRLADLLSNHTVEWRHTYGRNNHSLQLRVKILPLTPTLLNRTDLVTRPYCHIFWTDCSDLDIYRSSVKAEIVSWLNLLSTKENSEWMIVVIMGDVLSRLSKAKLQLPRMSITDKVKTDFCSKQPERFHVLHDPTNDSGKSIESWSSLVMKVSNITVRCMESVVSKYEDHVRSERERRNEKSWDFCVYFILQEELAFMYEMLGMLSSALVQYDELDAMFTQYVLNADAGDVAHWLSQFSRPIVRWHPLLLWKSVDNEARKTIVEGRASLIDIRNYLFSRLCHLLFEMGRSSEVTQRMHFFLHSIVNEISILEIEIPRGAVACWVFMCCLELVEALKRRVDLQNDEAKDGGSVETSDMTSEMLILENASLWNIARMKLYSLGNSCGLLPGMSPTSEQLQMVVDLLAGMSDGRECGEFDNSPSLILREALSSANNFQRHYFDLSELSMGTFKHMGRYRAARSIGSDLASFYLMMGDPSKAESYLVDAVRIFANDGWMVLYSRANQILARCYKEMNNVRKYIRLCYALMCDSSLSSDERSFYCSELQSVTPRLVDRNLSINIWPLATVTSIRFIPARTRFKKHSEHKIEVLIKCFATASINFDNVQISLDRDDLDDDVSRPSAFDVDTASTSSLFKVQIESDDDDTAASSGQVGPSRMATVNQPRKRRRHPSSLSSRDFMTQQFASIDSNGLIKLLTLSYAENSMKSRSNPSTTLLNLGEHKEEDKEGAIVWSGLTCKRAHEVLRRQDSSHSHFGKHSIVSSVTMETYSCCLSASEVTLHPGDNLLQIPLKTDVVGCFQLQQLRMILSKTFFVLPRIFPLISYKVTNKIPTFHVRPTNGLVCGVTEEIELIIKMGDYEIFLDENDATVHIDISDGIQILCPVHCSVFSVQDKEAQSSSPCSFSRDGPHLKLKIPSVTSQCSIVFQLVIVCCIAPTVVTLENRKRHRRTHSAPPATFLRSPKITPRHDAIVERNLTLQIDSPDLIKNGRVKSVEDEKPTNVSFELTSKSDDDKKDKKSALRPKVPSFRMFRSKTPNHVTSKSFSLSFNSWPSFNKTNKNSPREVPSLKINDDLIEVTLSDDGNHDDIISNSSYSMNTTENNSLRSFCYSSSESSPDEKQHPLVDKIPSKINHLPTHSYVGPLSLSLPPKKSYKQKQVVPPSGYQMRMRMPWDEVEEQMILFSTSRPLDFSHSWSYSSSRFLSVSVFNLTSKTLTLKNPGVRFCSSSAAEMIYMGCQHPVMLKRAGCCTFSWKVLIPSPSPVQLSAQFEVALSSSHPHLGDEVLSYASYKFELENVKPIYTVTCSIEDQSELVCGVMTNLKVEVEKLRHDPEHEPTSTGQQLVMFQVVDTRGRWAVCGKSNGILCFNARGMASNATDTTPVLSATLELMPLSGGFLHLPYVMLHRYMKRRSSEFDEELSSTESPVLKPPQLKPFERGEVFYRQQAKQLHVSKPDDVDNTRKITEL
ncbi:trafficking protein particle complex subunit 10-like isoform X1 [Clavelina lepadiformis]|uniref:trafficking protein particle complex subunit 10-like isoform X1 n=2 Tax=Clavelina lepadiformis TaxID=159417 RepID=UPI004041A1B1